MRQGTSKLEPCLLILYIEHHGLTLGACPIGDRHPEIVSTDRCLCGVPSRTTSSSSTASTRGTLELGEAPRRTGGGMRSLRRVDHVTHRDGSQITLDGRPAGGRQRGVGL